MTLPEIDEDEIQALVDGQLSADRCTAVLAQLGRNPEAIERVGQYALHKSDLRRRLETLDLAGDDPTTAALQRTLADRLLRPDYVSWLRRAASIALLLAAGWSSHVLYESYLQPHLPSLVVEAAQAHEVFGEDSQRPVELTAASRIQMAAWFSRHLGQPVEIPSLNAIGLRLVGGRLLSGDDGPVAQLIYEDAHRRRLTLCLSSEPAANGLEVELVEVDGLTAGYWQKGDLSYALVAETPDLQLVAIASELGAVEPEDLL
jgi:anti-sigma factor RsiW